MHAVGGGRRVATSTSGVSHCCYEPPQRYRLFLLFSKQIGMFFFDPGDKFFAQLFGEFPRVHNRTRCASCETNRTWPQFWSRYRASRSRNRSHGNDDSSVPPCISGCGQSGGRDLKRGVVSDVEAPVVVKTGSPSGGYITVGDGDEISDLVGRRQVRLQPSVSLPVL